MGKQRRKEKEIMKTPCEDLVNKVNKGSNFADFVRFRAHTYARTQQSLPPLMGGNNLESIITHLFLISLVLLNFR